MNKVLLIFTDGGARGNPGPAAIGFVIKDSLGNTLTQQGLRIGTATNNEAEYHAVIAGLQKAASLSSPKQTALRFFLDSKLVVEQLSGKWKIKEPRLARLAINAKNLEKNFVLVAYKHITRDKNSEADLLLNQALDS